MIGNVQALRGFAAMLVVIVHLAGPLRPVGDFAPMLSFGAAGVDLFFVISGFVMVYTSTVRPVTAGTFLLHRIIRVVPLYWGATFALFAMAALAPALMQGTRADAADLLQSLLFVPFIRSDGQLAPLFFLGWTLNYEIAFYLLFAGALAISRGRVGVTVAVATGLIAAAVVAGAALEPRSAALRFYSSPIIIEFAFGMLVGWWFTKDWVLGVASSAVGLSAGMLLLVTYPLLGLANHSAPLFVAAAAVVGGAVSLERHSLIVKSRSALLIGAASYALYLCHPFVMQAAAWVAGQTSQAAAVAVALSSLPFAAAGAILIHLIAERRVTSRLRALIECGGISARGRAFGEVCT